MIIAIAIECNNITRKKFNVTSKKGEIYCMLSFLDGGTCLNSRLLRKMTCLKKKGHLNIFRLNVMDSGLWSVFTIAARKMRQLLSIVLL